MHRGVQHSALSLVLLVTLVLPQASFAQRSVLQRPASGGQEQIGTILTVRKVPVGSHFVTRYPQIRYSRLYFTVRVSEQTYCGEYETPVIDEMNDLLAAKGADIGVVLTGKRLTVRTPKGAKLKAWLSEPRQC